MVEISIEAWHRENVNALNNMIGRYQKSAAYLKVLMSREARQKDCSLGSV